MAKILRKTCSSLVKIIFGGEINLKQNKYNELEKKVFFFDKNKCKYGIIYSSITVCMQDKIHIHDWAYFQHTATKNMDICDLKSYTHDLINTLFK